MSKNRWCLPLVTVIVVVAIGLLVGRSQAQPEKSRRAGPPFLLSIGKYRINPSQVSVIQTWNIHSEEHPDNHLTIHVGGRDLDFEFGTDGQAEALLEWFDAHSTELKPKPVKRK
jgi:hypothetical protein